MTIIPIAARWWGPLARNDQLFGVGLFAWFASLGVLGVVWLGVHSALAEDLGLENHARWLIKGWIGVCPIGFVALLMLVWLLASRLHPWFAGAGMDARVEMMFRVFAPAALVVTMIEAIYVRLATRSIRALRMSIGETT
jgi:hypothetical protein